MLPFNTFQNMLRFLRVCSTSLLKTMWEKEKSLVTSNFSFSHSVFYPFGELSTIFIKFEIVVCKLFTIGRVQNSSFGKGLKAFFLMAPPRESVQLKYCREKKPLFAAGNCSLAHRVFKQVDFFF